MIRNALFHSTKPSPNAVADYVGRLWWLFAGTAASLAFALGFPIFIRHFLPSEKPGDLAAAVALWFACYLVPLWLIAKALRSSFRQAPRPHLLATIVVSYAALIVVFAGVYYNMADVADNVDAWTTYRYYRAQGEPGRKHPGPVRPPVPSQRAFRGIEDRLWTGVEGYDTGAGWRAESSVSDMARLARQPAGQVLRENGAARPGVFLDCLHFSVMTMTTVGYGDITPATRYAKIAADLQALTGLALFVVALGMLFGNWWGEQPAVGRDVANALPDTNPS